MAFLIRRCRVLAVLLWAALSAGCDSAREYRAVVHDQIAALRETEQILAGISDPASMAAAKIQLESHNARFDDITERARDLPRPTEAVEARLREDAAQLQEVLKSVQQQVRRIRGLPG